MEDKIPCPVVHFEIGCKGLESTANFYSSIFGWTTTQVPMAAYINTNSAEGVQGHITSLGHEPYNYVTVYIQVNVIEEYLQKITDAGGTKLVGPVPLPDGSRFAWFKDPEGNILALLQKPQ
ncbi:MAG TPA: VOC family protein [Chitinophagaceae bacterium]|nr:VOC family protein [Chitinophagaceae bacterium]